MGLLDLYDWIIVYISVLAYSVLRSAIYLLPTVVAYISISIKEMMTIFLPRVIIFVYFYVSSIRFTFCINPWGICTVASWDCLMTWIEKSSGGIGI